MKCDKAWPRLQSTRSRRVRWGRPAVIARILIHGPTRGAIQVGPLETETLLRAPSRTVGLFAHLERREGP